MKRIEKIATDQVLVSTDEKKQWVPIVDLVRAADQPDAELAASYQGLLDDIDALQGQGWARRAAADQRMKRDLAVDVMEKFAAMVRGRGKTPALNGRRFVVVADPEAAERAPSRDWVEHTYPLAVLSVSHRRGIPVKEMHRRYGVPVDPPSIIAVAEMAR